MQGKQFYLKTFTTISLFLFFICGFIYVSTIYLIEDLEHFSPIGLYQPRRDAAVEDYHAGSNRESLFNKYVSNKNPRKLKNTYRKTIYAQNIQRGLLSIKPTKKPNTTDIRYNDVSEINTDNTTVNITEPENIYIGKQIISEEERNLRNNFLDSLKLDRRQLRDLEIETKKQHLVKAWHMQRQKRLTASLFGKACRLYNATARRNFVYYFLHNVNYTYTEKKKYRQEFAPTAKKKLEVILKRPIRPSGLMVDMDMPYLAATPDGLVGRTGLVEIKYPPSAKNMTPGTAIITKKITFCTLKKGRLHLKRSSNYYYQVQGQMHISNKMHCYFCIWTPHGLMYEVIYRNNTFWKRKMKSQLKKIYLHHLLPALIHRND